jgi:hypothetical protein
VISIKDIDGRGTQAFTRIRKWQSMQMPPGNTRETLRGSTRVANRPVLLKESRQRGVTVISIAEQRQQFGATVVAAIQCVNQRQGDPLVAQIAVDGLSQLAFITRVLQHIVNYLKSHAERLAVTAQRVNRMGISSAQHCADFCRSATNTRRLQANDFEIHIFRQIERACNFRFECLAAANIDTRFTEYPDRPQHTRRTYSGCGRLGIRREHLEDEYVSRQNRKWHAECRMDRRPTSPRLVAIDDIVMHQACNMTKFRSGGSRKSRIGIAADGSARVEDQLGSKEFPGGCNGMRGGMAKLSRLAIQMRIELPDHRGREVRISSRLGGCPRRRHSLDASVRRNASRILDVFHKTK